MTKRRALSRLRQIKVQVERRIDITKQDRHRSREEQRDELARLTLDLDALKFAIGHLNMTEETR
jgi:hypothetical protein